MVILQAFSTGLWRVMKLDISRFWISVYVVSYQCIVGLFYATIGLSNAENFRRSFETPIQDQVDGRKEGNSSRNKLRRDVKIDDLAEATIHDSIHGHEEAPLNLSRPIDKFFAILSHILRSTYLIHDGFLAWHFARSRGDFSAEVIYQVIYSNGHLKEFFEFLLR